MTTTKTLFRSLLLGSVLAAAGCGDDPNDSDGNDGGQTEGGNKPEVAACDAGQSLTFDVDVAPILERHCLQCHASTAVQRFGAPTGVDFDGAAAAERWADGIAARTAQRTMPPRNADAVTDDEICALETWAKQL